MIDFMIIMYIDHEMHLKLLLGVNLMEVYLNYIPSL